LPNWFTFSSSGSETQTIDATPPTGAYNGYHTIFATFTPTNGSPPTYTAVTIEVTCTITAFALPTTPAEPTFDLSYIIFDGTLTIDLSGLVYQESPDCLYTTTSVYTWTGLDADFMVEDPNNPAIVSMQTNDKTQHVDTPHALTF
jgi:hypothetical protein